MTANKQDDAELLDCPFCGGDAVKYTANKIGEEYAIMCANCFVRTSDDYDDRPDVIWNTRQNAVAVDIKKLKEEAIAITYKWLKAGIKDEPYRIELLIDELSRRGLIKSQEGAGKITDTPIRDDATTPLTDEEIRVWTFVNMELLINDKYKGRNFPLFMSKLLTEVVDCRKAAISQGEEQ